LVRLLVVLLAFPSPLAAATFTVTSTVDSGPGSLRECIGAVNGSLGPHRIVFNIPGSGVQTIHLLSNLGTINNTVAIDGRSQPGYNTLNGPLIELDGTNAQGNGFIFMTSAPHSSVKGITFNRFPSSPVNFYADACSLSACYSGVNAAGTAASSNAGYGVYVTGKQCMIGGHFVSDRNILSGNTAAAIFIGVGAFSNAAQDSVLGNYIGTDVTGTVGITSGIWAMEISSAPSVVIGGPGPSEGNIIDSSTQSGIYAYSAAPVAPDSGISIYRNFIGTDASGQHAIPNAQNGIELESGYANIGGIGLGNVISGNHGSGIHVLGASSAYNVISGNRIGVTANGTGKLGNFVRGIELDNSNNNFIGGNTTDGSGNLIGGNGNEGIGVEGANATNNIIEGNAIGTSFNGAIDLGNNTEGIAVGGDFTLIGETVGNAGNIIAHNQGGIFVFSLQNTMRGNSIFNNEVQLGIDLYTGSPNPVTLNDSLDTDDGPNYLQNFPVITSVSVVGSQVRLQGRYSSETLSDYLVDFYSNRQCNSWGYGEGESWLGSTSVSTNAIGLATFDVSFPLVKLVGNIFTCTATDFLGDTSEFSPCAPLATQTAAEPPGPPGFAFAPPLPSPARRSTSLTFTLAHPSSVSLRAYDVSGREVSNLAQGAYDAGPHTVAWNVAGLRAGVYFCRLRAVSSDPTGEEETATRSIIVVH
jgi:hypothetical protein